MTESEKINKIVNEGHVIAEKMRSVNDIDGLEALISGKINTYGNFVDDNFGVYEPDDLFNEKSCELTTFLYVALDWKRKTLYPENKDSLSTKKNFESFLNDFEKYLDSKEWVSYSFGVDRKSAD